MTFLPTTGLHSPIVKKNVKLFANSDEVNISKIAYETTGIFQELLEKKLFLLQRENLARNIRRHNCGEPF